MKVNIIYLLIPFFLVSSCAKVESPNVAVSVLTEVEKDGQKTKGVVEGSSFGSGDTFGLFVYHAGSGQQNGYNSYGSKYANIKASRETGKWYYTLNGSPSNEKSENFFLIESSAGGALDIYAYAPHIAGTTSITDIEFTIGGDDHSKISDLMWAESNDNKNIALTGSNKRVNFKFKHALSMIRINLKCKYEGTTMQISSIKIKKRNDGNTPLYKSGHFNAVTGEFSDLSDAEEVVFGCYNTAYTFTKVSSRSVPLLIVPTEYKTDGDYEIVFEFNGHELWTTYGIQLVDIAVDDISKFEPGKVYDFTFVFDNYAQISDVYIDTSEEWEKEFVNREY